MNQNQKSEEVIDLGVLICDIWKGFKKFWWLLPILCCLVMGMVLGYKVKSYFPVYQAQATFTVSTTGAYQESDTSYSFYYSTATAEQMTKLFPYILSSDALQELMKEDLGMEGLPGSVSATGVANSNLITMTAISSDPDMARQLLESAMKYFPEVSRYVIGETRFNVIQPASTPTEPMNKPNFRPVLKKAALLGCLLFCGFLGLYALLRRTIRREEDIREKLNLTCAGVVPRIHFKAHRKAVNNRLDIHNPRIGEAFGEAVERLSFKVEKQLDAHNWKVLVITSTLPGEGKSSISWNLAQTLADSGKKVLLVDADLRKPSLYLLAGMANSKTGLAEILEGKGSTDDVIRVHASGVRIVSGSKGSSNPHGLLSSGQFRQWIQEQKEAYDYVLIDTPPCGMLSDAGAVAQCGDAALYIIRQDTAKVGQILDGIQNIAGNDVPLLGGVLNVADVSLSGYGYRYSGYNRYGYYGKYGKYGRYGESREK